MNSRVKWLIAAAAVILLAVVGMFLVSRPSPTALVQSVEFQPQASTSASEKTDKGTSDTALSAPPQGVQSSPSCSLTVTTERGTHTFNGADENNEVVVLPGGEDVQVEWASSDATDATVSTAGSQQEIKTAGQATYTVTRDAAYTFSFSGLDGSTTCAFAVRVVTPSFDTTGSSLSSSSATPTITGAIGDAPSVRLVITDLNELQTFFDSGVVHVVNGRWSVDVSTPLSDGTYAVTLYDGLTDTPLISPDLTVSSQGAGAVSITPTIEPVDSTIESGQAVPAVTIQLTNTGNGLLHLNGFRLQRTGSSPGSVIIGLGVRDSTGNCVGGSGGEEGYSPFQDSDSSEIFCSTTMAPGESRTFTITAGLSNYAYYYPGTSFALTVTGVDTSSPVSPNYLPIAGGTFTIANK